MKAPRLIILFLISLSPFLQAQENIQVVSKTVTKAIPFQAGNQLQIKANRADVFINTWNRNEIKVQMRFVAKHPNRDIATKQLDRVSHSILKTGQNIQLSNRFPEVSDKYNASLSVRYQLLVPKDCKISLENYFGLVQVTDLDADLTIESEFTAITLQSVSGEVDIQSYFGNIEAQYLSGAVQIDSRRSNIEMSELAGKVNITAEYATLKIDTNNQLASLDIDAQQSDVLLRPRSSVGLGYQLEAAYGEIQVGKILPFNFTEQNETAQKAISGNAEKEYQIKVSTTFGNIRIEE